jgi:hypothetical protein
VTIPERRRFPRYPLQIDLEIEWGSEMLPALVTDISLSGMFIATNNPLWVGATFKARLLLGEPVKVDCVVRRVLPGKGMGVLFVEVSEETRAQLESLISTISQ